MKTIFRLLCGLMAIAITAACSHEELLQTEPVQKPSEGKMVSVKAYTPSEQPASRLAFDDQGTEGLKLSWSEGDAFTAVVGNDKVTFTYDANTKKFSGTLPVDATLTDGVNAYYPAYTDEYVKDFSTQTGALNSATTYMEGAYDATAQAFKFNHSTAILKVAFSGLPQNAEIESISVDVITVGSTSQITFSNAANSLYINLPILAKGSKLVFYVETTAGLYTTTQTVTVDAGIEVGKFYVAHIALAEATVCNLPMGSTFCSVIGYVIGDATSIVFEANSTETGGTQIGSSTAYAKVVGTTLKIYTAANEFVFKENCSSMFYYLDNIQTIDFGNHINTENVTLMNSMFSYCKSLSSLDLSCFNTENVTHMNSMFFFCSSLTSLDVSCFNTAKVTNMNSMFSFCASLTSLDVSSFNTANVTDMNFMFQSCLALESLDLSNFNTAKVMDMNSMFNDCNALTSLDLSSFNFSGVQNFEKIFYNLGNSAENQPIPVYVTAAGYNILKDKDTNIPNSATYVYSCELPTGSTFNSSVSGFLASNTSLTKIKFIANSDNANTNNPIETSGAYMVVGSDNTLEIHTAVAEFVFNADCSSMFDGLSTITAISFNDYVNTANVTNMASMFDGCSSLESLDLSSFDTANVTDMNFMFNNCSSLQSITFGNNFNTANVTNMDSMFSDCSALTSLDLSSFNTSNVTDMNGMFFNCESLSSLNVSSFNTAKVTDMDSMFYGCSLLTSLDLSSFDTSKVTTMYCMFNNCFSISELRLINFDFHNVTDFDYMFYDLAKNDAQSVQVYVYVTQDSYNILKDKDTSINSAYAWFVNENGIKY